jgi:hypothetical protein
MLQEPTDSTDPGAPSGVLGSRVLSAPATESTAFAPEFFGVESSVLVQATGHMNDRPKIQTPTDLRDAMLVI